MADFSCKMNNKLIIKFGLRRISELFRPRSRGVGSMPKLGGHEVSGALLGSKKGT